MSVVVGTAGHIDHGKTSLLRALTGIDADRLPEEQRRGMTIDVGYAHLPLPDGDELDFVDVPGHDRLIGNMLVGAGEIDAALIVIAADDGPRAQTIEHLELLDALGIRDAVAVITKIDVLAEGDPRLAQVSGSVEQLLARTTMAGSPVRAVSSVTGEGLDALRTALVDLGDRVRNREAPAESGTEGGGPARSGQSRLAIDRAFAVKGRGVVVTGSLRGGSIERGRTLRLDPGGRMVRVREVQVHGTPVDRAMAGRVALNLAAIELRDVRRGMVLSEGPAVEVTDRLLVSLRGAVPLGFGAQGVVADPAARSSVGSGDRALRHGLRVRVHLGTVQVDGTLDLGRRVHTEFVDADGELRTTAVLRLDEPIATAFGDRFVLRRPSPGDTLAGGRVLDPHPPRRISRRRASPERLVALARAINPTPWLVALVELHGALPAPRAEALAAAVGEPTDAGVNPLSRAAPVVASRAKVAGMILARDVIDGLDEAAASIVAEHAAADPLAAGIQVVAVRTQVARELRRRAFVPRDSVEPVAAAVLDRLVTNGRLVQIADRLQLPSAESGPSVELRAAMDRLETALSVAAPPPLADAARAAGCPIDGIRALESGGRIVRIEDDLAWAASTWSELEALAVRLAAAGPLSPAAFRDATGTNRRFSLAILEDLDRRGVLRRTPAGHVMGPRARSVGARP